MPGSVLGLDLRGEWFKVSNLEALYFGLVGGMRKEAVYVIADSSEFSDGKKMR